MTRSYGSITGLKTDSLPWRLWEKAKRLQWNPADIDFGQDAEDWQKLSIEEQLTVGFLARTFMVGEEAVTLDILPLIKVMADQGKTEDTMFLTTFVFDEAKHVEFFRRFFDAVGFDPAVIDQLRQMDRASGGESGARSRGEVGGRIGARRIFDEELPRVMNRLSTDPSPEAILDATLTYNQFVEGVLAIAGYRVWYRISGERGILPGMKEGLGYVQRDERRHIAYGTYLPRLIIAEHPELWNFVVQRMEALRDNAFPQLRPDEERLTTPSGLSQRSWDGNEHALRLQGLCALSGGPPHRSTGCSKKHESRGRAELINRR